MISESFPEKLLCLKTEKISHKRKRSSPSGFCACPRKKLPPTNPTNKEALKKRNGVKVALFHLITILRIAVKNGISAKVETITENVFRKGIETGVRAKTITENVSRAETGKVTGARAETVTENVSRTEIEIETGARVMIETEVRAGVITFETREGQEGTPNVLMFIFS